MPRHIRKGDQVVVTSGDHKGRTGEVLEVITKSDQVLVKGINIHKRHIRPTQINPQGGTVERELPIHISNVSPIAGGKPTRVRFRINDDGSKERIAASTGESLGLIRGPRSK